MFFSVITWRGIPGRISSLEIIWSFSPVAASASLTVLYPLFSGRASCIVLIFVVMGLLSREAIAIWFEIESFPSYRMHSRKLPVFVFLTSRTTPFPSSLVWIFSFRNFWERAVSIARISDIPSPVSAEHGMIATDFVKSSILEYMSAVIPCEWRDPIMV